MSQSIDTPKQTKTKAEIIYENEMMKRQYFDYLKQSKGFSDSSIDTYERAILQWQDFTKSGDFGLFSKKRAIEFKEWLATRKSYRGEKVSVSYQYHSLRKLKGFFDWLSRQEGYRSRIQSTDIEFLSLAKKEARQALQTKRRKIPSMKQVQNVIESIDASSEIGMRDRALISFTLLTGARIAAIVSLPMKAFDKDDLVVDQDPNLGVKTKFSKRITTLLLPIEYKEAQEHFLQWYKYLETKRRFKGDDPIFPATKIENGKENISYYSTGEVEKVYWAGTGSARKIFEKRFKAAGEPYYHPHSFRHLLVKEFMKKPLTEEQKKAISQNFGHEHVSTTFGSYGYGHIAEPRQIELLRDIDNAIQGGSVRYNLSEEELHKLLRKAAEKEEG